MHFYSFWDFRKMIVVVHNNGSSSSIKRQKQNKNASRNTQKPPPHQKRPPLWKNSKTIQRRIATFFIICLPSFVSIVHIFLGHDLEWFGQSPLFRRLRIANCGATSFLFSDHLNRMMAKSSFSSTTSFLCTISSSSSRWSFPSQTKVPFSRRRAWGLHQCQFHWWRTQSQSLYCDPGSITVHFCRFLANGLGTEHPCGCDDH